MDVFFLSQSTMCIMGGSVVTGVECGSRVPPWSPYRGYYVVVLGKKSYFHSASLHTDFMFGGRGLTCDGLVTHPRWEGRNSLIFLILQKPG